MGAIRGILLVVVCVLLFISVLVGGILWAISSSLQYEHVQPGLSSLVDEVIDSQVGAVSGELDIEEEIESLMPMIETYCAGKEEYVFVYGGESITIPCDVLVQGPAAVISEGVDSLIEQYYYQEYNCNFWDCFGESDIPLFLISEKAQDYWQGKFRLVLLAFFVLVGLAFLLFEKKTNFFIFVGGLSIVGALPLLKVGTITSRLTSSVGNLGEYASDLVLIFFNQSQNVFIRIVLFGGVLLVVGIVLKIFKIGFSIANFFGKFKGKGSKKVKVVEKVKEEKPVKEKKVSKKKEK